MSEEQIEALKHVYQMLYDRSVSDEDAGIAQWILEQNFATDFLQAEEVENA